jgi:hypothetical protein
MIFNTKKTTIFFLVATGCFFLFSPQKATALSGVELQKLSGGVVGSAMDQAFSQLGIDKNELKYSIQTANVSRRKKQQPQIELSFSPDNPVSGKKVTVTATPSYFSNSTENIYFTWYLKTDGCPDKREPSPSDDVKKKCDTDGNGIININDYKVKATRILAGNDFEWDKADYSSGTAGKSYNAIFGGNNQEGKSNHCYVHDVDSGDEFEITCDEHLFPHVDIGGRNHEIGKGSFGLDDEKFFHLDPNDPDTADTGNGDEANVVGLGTNTFSWNYTKGDKIGVVIEGISMEPTQKADSSYKIMWAFVNNKCVIDYGNNDYPKTEITTIVSDPVADTPLPGQTTTVTTKTTVYKYTPTNINNYIYVRTITTIEVTTEVRDSATQALISTNTVTTRSTTCPDYPYQYGIGAHVGELNYFTDPNFPENGDVVCTAKDEEIDTAQDMSIAKASDLNKCLYNNFADPAEGGGAKTKIDLTLSYLPDFPMNDPGTGSDYNKDGDGDQLTVQSSITNADNPGYLKYSWQLYESDEYNTDSWGNPISKSRLPDSIQLSGMGMDSFKLKLNIPDLKKYLKVKLTVTENSTGSSETRKGVADVIIPISKISQRIRAYGASVSDTLGLSLKANELCLNENKPDAVCYVAKNEIVGLSVSATGFSDFLWTVNNDPLKPVPPATSSGNTVYFPVLENNGYRYNVEMIATNDKGEKINLSKAFEVADPEVVIASADEYVLKPNLLGHYIDVDGKYWPDYSKTNFSALSETPIKLKALFYGITPAVDQYSWLVDGIEITKKNAAIFGYSIDDSGILTLTEKKIGETYNVGVGIVYTQDKNTKKALSKYWGVQPDKFYEKKIGAAIEIKFVGSLSETQGAGKDNLPKKILAQMYGAAPAYVVFLLRIVLTTFAMLIFSRIILSFFPDLKENEY